MPDGAPSPERHGGGAGEGSRFSLVRVLVVLLPLVWLLTDLVPCTLATAPERARRTKCTSNLKQIIYACQLYAGDNGGVFPPELAALAGDYVSDGELFICPSTDRRSGGHHPWRGPLDDANLSYSYVAGLKATDDGDCILAFDEEWNHDREGLVVVYVGGRISWVRNVETLHVRLKEQSAALKARGREMEVLRPSWSKWPDPPLALPARTDWRPRHWLILGGVAVLVGLLVTAAAMRIVRRFRDGSARA
jgi:hypothetical protein